MRREALALVAALGLGSAQPAAARSTSVLPYPAADVWPTAIRFLRIDRGATLREKDPESGYVLFELPEAQKLYKGSLELVRTTDPEDRDATRLVVTLPDLPRHFEITLLDKLAAKLKDEYGGPLPPPPRKPVEPPKKPPPPDGGVLPRPPRGELPRPDMRGSEARP